MPDELQLKIKEYRMLNGWTQGQLARRMDCVTSLIHKHENHHPSISIAWAIRYANAFGITFMDLLPDSLSHSKLTPAENTLLGQWKNISSEHKTQILELVSAMAKIDLNK